jgi:hypothetical protein
MALFINMANLYWWETAHRYMDANLGLGSDIAWMYGLFNVFFLTYVTVNMFVAVITTVFMDVRSQDDPSAGLGGERETLEQKREGEIAELAQKTDNWSKPFYFVSALGGRGPLVESQTEEPADRNGLIWQPWFDQMILGWIFLNTFGLAAERHFPDACDDPDTLVVEMQSDELCQPQWFIDTNMYANYVFNFVFTVECILKILGMGFREYIKIPFNTLDFFIVVTSALDMMGEAASGDAGDSKLAFMSEFKVFRVFRVLRVARLLYRNENLRRVLITVFGSGEAIANLILFICFATLLFAILGMHLTGGLYIPTNDQTGYEGSDLGYGDNSGSLWGRLAGNGVYTVTDQGLETERYGYDVTDFIRKGLIPRRNFEDFPRGFLLSFQIMTGDDWVNQLHDVMEVKGGIIPVVLFFTNFAFCNFILLSLFIAVILENFEIAEAEKAALQKEKYKKDQEEEKAAAERPKITFVHRLVWLFGGEGRASGFGCRMGKDVELDVNGKYGPRDLKGEPKEFGTLMPGDKWYNDDKALFFMGPEHPARVACRALAENVIFDTVVLAAILLGTVMLAYEGPPGNMTDECEAVDLSVCAAVSDENTWSRLANATTFAADVESNRALCIAASSRCTYTEQNTTLGQPQKCAAAFKAQCAAVNSAGDRDAMKAACDALGSDCTFGFEMYLFEIIGYILFLIFLVEFVCKTIGYGFMFTPEAYLKVSWNKLDFIVIIGSILNYIPGVNVGFVKLLRCLRPLRLINRNEGMRVIISAVLNSLAVNVGVLALSGLGLLIFAILGVGMFAGQFYTCNCGYVYPQGITPHNSVFDANGGWTVQATGEFFAGPPATVMRQQDCVGVNGTGGVFGVDPAYPDTISQCYWDNRPYNFDTALNAAMALFSASTLAGWTDIMEIGLDTRGIGEQPVPFSGLWYLKVWYFLLYVIVMAFFVTNLFVGVLIDFIGNSDGTALLTETQQANLDMQKFKRLHRPAKREAPPANPWRKWMYNLAESQFWDTVSNSFIIFNVVVMMCEYEDQTDAWWNTLELLNMICLWFFTVEMFIKLIGYFPKKYISEGWNRFDATVIILSWAAIIFDLGSVQAIRAFRALRIVLVLKNAKGIRSIFQTLILSIAPATNISVLMLLLYAFYAMIGMMAFGNMPIQNVDCTQETGANMGRINDPEYCQWEDPDGTNFTEYFTGIAKGKPGQVLIGLNRQYTHHSNFRSFGSAMCLLFQCAAGQDWKFVMYAVGGEPGQPSAQSGLAFLYFMTFLFFSNYILLNLFVAVILDNFSASMREQELDISEEDFAKFKYTFRDFTSDKHPEELPYPNLWSLMATVGSKAGHDDEGNVIESVLSPPARVKWLKPQYTPWRIAQGAEASQAGPSDLKAFLHALYEQDNSPLQEPHERIGITFDSFYDTLIQTPAMFESAHVNVDGPWEAYQPGAWEEQPIDPLSGVWETYRAIVSDPDNELDASPPSYDVIEWAIQTLRFRVRYYKLCGELAFHGHIFKNESSTLTYNDLLQAMVNMSVGDAGLSLEETMRRELENTEQANGSGNAIFRQANWLRIIEQTEANLLKQLDGANLNSNVSVQQRAALEKNLATVQAAKWEIDPKNEPQSQAAREGGGADAEGDEDDDFVAQDGL